MKRFWTTFFLAITTSLLVGALFYVALKQHYPAWRELHLVNASLSGMMAMFSGVAAGLFVYSMRSFKRELRRAYVLLCIGIVLFGLAQVQFPVASYLNAYFWYVDGFIGIPYLAAVLFIFVGMRAFARILRLRTRWASWRWLLAASVAVPVVAAFLPHPTSDLTAVQLIGSNALTAFDAVFLAFAAMTVVRIRQLIGPRYVHAMTWLAVAFTVNVAAGVHYIAVNLLTTSTFNWYFYDDMSTEPFFIGSLLLVYAGYAMVMVDRPGRAVAAVGDGTTAKLPLVDIITYLASLASKPQELDPVLDPLRDVTSRLNPGQALSPEDEHKLRGVCRNVVQYLLTGEPLRAFTAENLQRQLAQTFQLEPAMLGALWPRPAQKSAPKSTRPAENRQNTYTT